MKDIRQRLLATFQVEHKEHVQRIRETLAAFETSEHAPTGPDLDEAFRRAHSLKGAARAVDLRPVENLAHRLETLFSRIRDGSMRLDKPVIKVMSQVLDASEDWLASMTGGQDPAHPAQALAAIDTVLSGAAAPSVPPPAQQAPSDSPAAPAPSAALGELDTVRLNAESLDRIVSSAGQLLTESLRQQQVTQQLRHVSQHLAETAGERTRVRKAAARAFQTLDSSPELAAAARYVNYLEIGRAHV